MAARKTSSTVYADPEPQEEPTPEPQEEPTPRASGDPGECGETPCWERTPLVVTQANVGLNYTFNTGFKGNIDWMIGEEGPYRRRGPFLHTFAGPGSFEVVAWPVASSCVKSGALTVTVA